MQSKLTYPTVLLFGHSFDNTTGLGITLANLFHDWPKENIALMADYIDVRTCDNVRPCEIYIGKDISSGGGQRPRGGAFRGILKPIHTKLNLGELRYSAPVLSPEDRQKIEDFAPDIIFCCLGSLNMMKRCEAMADAFPKSKLVLYVVDDWVNTRPKEKFPALLWERRYDAMFRKLLKRCAGLLTICDAMAESYKEQYGIESLPFHNPVDLKHWKSIISAPRYSEDITSILYVGKINYDTHGTLLEMAKVVTDLNRKGKKYVFDVYTPNYSSFKGIFDEYPDCNIFPAVGHEEIITLIKSYSVLYLTLGFSKTSRRYVRLSMPTKMTEYLASGRPTLLYCPEDIALAKFVSKNKCAELCFENSNEALVNALLAVSINREQIVTNASQVVNDHDISNVRRRFKDCMCKFAEH